MMTILTSENPLQFIWIGMAAFCISFGLIYSVIAWVKWRSNKQRSCDEDAASEESQALGVKAAASSSRRKSTSLTSPPFLDSVVNPNYNISPYKMSRHLKPSSGSYSPTHYLSPHHRRNSTPTQQSFSPSSPSSILLSSAFSNTCHKLSPTPTLLLQKQQPPPQQVDVDGGNNEMEKASTMRESSSPCSFCSEGPQGRREAMTRLGCKSSKKMRNKRKSNLNRTSEDLHSITSGNATAIKEKVSPLPLPKDGGNTWNSENDEDDDFLSMHRYKVIPVYKSHNNDDQSVIVTSTASEDYFYYPQQKSVHMDIKTCNFEGKQGLRTMVGSRGNPFANKNASQKKKSLSLSLGPIPPPPTKLRSSLKHESESDDDDDDKIIKEVDKRDDRNSCRNEERESEIPALKTFSSTTTTSILISTPPVEDRQESQLVLDVNEVKEKKKKAAGGGRKHSPATSSLEKFCRVDNYETEKAFKGKVVVGGNVNVNEDKANGNNNGNYNKSHFSEIIDIPFGEQVNCN